jgi:hypothetical protein
MVDGAIEVLSRYPAREAPLFASRTVALQRTKLLRVSILEIVWLREVVMAVHDESMRSRFDGRAVALTPCTILENNALVFRLHVCYIG